MAPKRECCASWCVATVGEPLPLVGQICACACHDRAEIADWANRGLKALGVPKAALLPLPLPRRA